MKSPARSLLLAPLAAAVLLTGCGAQSSAVPLGQPVAYQAGAATLEFSVEDVREAGQSELTALGLSTTLEQNQSAYFVTNKIALTDWTIADLKAVDGGPYPSPAEDITLNGNANYRNVKVLGSKPDCTPDNSATNGVSVDEPYRTCEIYLGRAGSLPQTVQVKDIGTWTTKS